MKSLRDVLPVFFPISHHYHYFLKMHFLLLIILSLIASTLADLTCVPYVPFKWHHHAAKIQFQKSKTLPNATDLVAGPLATLATGNQTGTVFGMEACTSTSLNISSTITDGDGDDEGFSINNTTYIRFINPATGHCLAAKNLSADRTTLTFEPCNAAPTDFAQIWQVDQQIYYNQMGRLAGWGPPYIDAVNPNVNALGYVAYSQWIIAPDHRTVEVWRELKSYLFAYLVKP